MIPFNPGAHIAFCVAAYQRGKTLEEIGKIFGVSRERIRQILERSGMVTAEEGGQARKTFEKAAQKSASLRERKYEHMKAWDCSRADYERIVLEGGGKTTTPGSALKAYSSQRRTALVRGIAWEMNLVEWWNIWRDSNLFHLRGKGHGKYVMARFNDEGPYAVNNVYIVEADQNIRDYQSKRHGKQFGDWSNAHFPAQAAA